MLDLTLSRNLFQSSYFDLRMTDILNGPKSHDLQFHLLEDVVRHGNPSGFDVS